MNRPKAERSHPGVCPRRRSSERNPLTGGPVWDRPLRRSPDRLLYFCRGDPCGRPPTQVLRHPLPGLAAAGEVVQAHVKKSQPGPRVEDILGGACRIHSIDRPAGIFQECHQPLAASIPFLSAKCGDAQINQAWKRTLLLDMQLMVVYNEYDQKLHIGGI